MTPSSDSKKPKSPGKGTSARGPAQAQRGRRPKQPARETSGGEHGILSNLPSTRPQRPSARRAAAKRAAAKDSDRDLSARSAAKDPAPAPSSIAGKPASSGPAPAERRAATRRAKPASAKPRTTPPPLPPAEPPVPPQGFEGEDEIQPGTPVQPPSRPEVAGALAELVGDLAQTGLTRGGRLVRDALGRLPGI